MSEGYTLPEGERLVAALERIARALEAQAQARTDLIASAVPVAEPTPPPDWSKGLPEGWKEESYVWETGKARKEVKVLRSPSGRTYTRQEP